GHSSRYFMLEGAPHHGEEKFGSSRTFSGEEKFGSSRTFKSSDFGDKSSDLGDKSSGASELTPLESFNKERGEERFGREESSERGTPRVGKDRSEGQSPSRPLRVPPSPSFPSPAPISGSAPAAGSAPGFTEFWSAYPRRGGDNPRED